MYPCQHLRWCITFPVIALLIVLQDNVSLGDLHELSAWISLSCNSMCALPTVFQVLNPIHPSMIIVQPEVFIAQAERRNEDACRAFGSMPLYFSNCYYGSLGFQTVPILVLLWHQVSSKVFLRCCNWRFSQTAFLVIGRESLRRSTCERTWSKRLRTSASFVVMWRYQSYMLLFTNALFFQERSITKSVENRRDWRELRSRHYQAFFRAARCSCVFIYSIGHSFR